MHLIKKLIFTLSTIAICHLVHAEQITKPHFFKAVFGSQIHYLLGTHHYFVSWDELPLDIHKHFQSSKTLILEVSFDDKMRSVISTQLDSLKPLTPKNLSKNQIQKLKNLGISERLFPFSESDDCEMYYVFPHKGNLPYYILDVDLYFKAKDSGKKIFTLDTDELIKKSKELTPADGFTNCQIGKILDTESEDEILEVGRKAIESYRAGPEKAIPSTNPGYIYRNQMWMPELLKIFKKDNSFLAVGVAHLYGEKGLIKLLEKEGYTVTPIQKF